MRTFFLLFLCLLPVILLAQRTPYTRPLHVDSLTLGNLDENEMQTQIAMSIGEPQHDFKSLKRAYAGSR